VKLAAVLLLLSSLLFGDDAPKYGWKKLGSEAFSLDATEHKYFRLPSGRLRMEFKGEDAIYAGVMTPEQYAQFSNGKYLELIHFRSFHCVKESIIEAVQNCNVPMANAMLAIRDKRGPVTRAMGGYSALHPLKGGGDMADRAMKPNKVSVTLYRWDCLENCPVPPPK
jgi:hypothetical protein